MAAEKVLLSGASGFIAGHILKLLIDSGYTVVGTVRSEGKGEFLKKLYPKNFEYAIVEDISEPNAFDAVFQANPDFTYVLHTASPFTFNATSAEKDFLRPAVQGTLSILNSTKVYGLNVKKVVVTSSFAAVISLNPDEDSSVVYTEDLGAQLPTNKLTMIIIFSLLTLVRRLLLKNLPGSSWRRKSPIFLFPLFRFPTSGVTPSTILALKPLTLPTRLLPILWSFPRILLSSLRSTLTGLMLVMLLVPILLPWTSEELNNKRIFLISELLYPDHSRYSAQG